MILQMMIVYVITEPLNVSGTGSFFLVTGQAVNRADKQFPPFTSIILPFADNELVIGIHGSIFDFNFPKPVKPCQ
jgi:hypothetical protein